MTAPQPSMRVRAPPATGQPVSLPLSFVQKRHYRFRRFLWAFVLRGMAAVLEDDKLRSRYGCVKRFADAQFDKLVLITPEHQRRRFDSPDAVIQIKIGALADVRANPV